MKVSFKLRRALFQPPPSVRWACLDMPRKARLLPRKRPGAGGPKRERVDRAGRTYDVAVCCSHVNSYPLARKSGTFRPIEAAASVVPRRLLEALGIERVPADEVTLKPYLMAHAVEQ